MKPRWRAGRVWLLWTVLCKGCSWLAPFLPLLFFVCLFVCLFVFPCVHPWMKCSGALNIAQRHGSLSAKRILHCLSALPHLLLLTGYLLLLLFWQADLSSSHSTSSFIAHLSPSHSLNFSPSFGNFTAFYLSGQSGGTRG